MSHASSYESVSSFSPEVRISVRLRFWIRVGVDFSVSIRVSGVFLSG